MSFKNVCRNIQFNGATIIPERLQIILTHLGSNFISDMYELSKMSIYTIDHAAMLEHIEYRTTTLLLPAMEAFFCLCR
jgi:hypothetical protein